MAANDVLTVPITRFRRESRKYMRLLRRDLVSTVVITIRGRRALVALSIPEYERRNRGSLHHSNG